MLLLFNLLFAIINLTIVSSVGYRTGTVWTCGYFSIYHVITDLNIFSSMGNRTSTCLMYEYSHDNNYQTFYWTLLLSDKMMLIC